ncbi:MAG: lytic transglycosylase domain-containing protein [Oligoflexales bacterium]
MRSLGNFVLLVSFAIVAGAGLWVGHQLQPTSREMAARYRFTHQNLLDETGVYEARINTMNQNPNCLPIHVSTQAKISFFYLHCSEAAIKRDTQALKITPDFSVDERLARRVHFWHKIYALWSKDEFVLHVAEYPEVVLEMARSNEPETSNRNIIEIKKALQAKEIRYAEILRSLHRKSLKRDFSYANLDPAERRVYDLMSHIPDRAKFSKAAGEIRVQRGQREFIKKGIEMSSRYLPTIEKSFEELGIPKDLAKIAFVESSFNINALSKVGASGVYQFMPFAAREYLIINSGIDERRDPIKSGLAAAKLFKANYGIVPHWPLAVTAYNHGAYGVRRAAQSVHSTELADLVENYDGRGFGFASKNFYSEFLGILLTLSNKYDHFIDLDEDTPMQFEAYKLPSWQSISQIKKKFGVNESEILAYNPDLMVHFVRRNGHLPKGFVIKLPVSIEREKVADEKDSLRAPRKSMVSGQAEAT